MNLPSEFFTVASMGTLIGLTGMTYVVVNGVDQAFNWRRPWFGFVVAVALSEVSVMLTKDPELVQFVIGLVNGCLVFITAGGASGAARAALARPIQPQAFREELRKSLIDSRFFKSWF